MHNLARSDEHRIVDEFEEMREREDEAVREIDMELFHKVFNELYASFKKQIHPTTGAVEDAKWYLQNGTQCVLGAHRHFLRGDHRNEAITYGQAFAHVAVALNDLIPHPAFEEMYGRTLAQRVDFGAIARKLRQALDESERFPAHRFRKIIESIMWHHRPLYPKQQRVMDSILEAFE